MNTQVDFENTSKAFSAKSDSQLKKSFWLFNLMKYPGVVNFFSKLTLIALKAGLPIKKIIKNTIFDQFCGGENLLEAKTVVNNLNKSNIGSILDYSVEGENTESDFEHAKTELIKIIELAKNDSAIPYTSLKLTGVMSSEVLEKLSAKIALSNGELIEFNNGKKRLEAICKEAYNCNVPIYFDAEESWIQEHIDRLAEEMMRKFNSKKAIILTTLQMYRWDRINYLNFLLRMAAEENISVGIKLVRGAYLEKENARALQFGYPSPIQASKEKTDEDFDKAITICLKNIKVITLCAGTHNEASTMYLLHEMQRLNVENNHPHVYFSQLYGMSDHITYNLAAAQYNVTKYLPYGPIKAVVPYLIRRAQENTSIAGQMGRELKLILEEKKKRATQQLLTSGNK
ncbi:MAG: proline dehydrogenase family protein [Bacteroidia bacterium]